MTSVLRVHQRVEPSLSPDDRHRLARLSSAVISDNLERDAGIGGVRLISDIAAPERVMVGPALTVRTRPGDNLAVHHALDLARPGDVVLVDARGELVNAIIGELMVAYAAHRGIAGLVVDGAIRDRRALRSASIPVFARGWTHQGPYKTGPGEIHGPISMGGRFVCDGDIVVGDADGVVVIPHSRLAETLPLAEAKQLDEQQQLIDIENGRWDRSWITDASTIVR